MASSLVDFGLILHILGLHGGDSIILPQNSHNLARKYQSLVIIPDPCPSYQDQHSECSSEEWMCVYVFGGRPPALASEGSTYNYHCTALHCSAFDYGGLEKGRKEGRKEGLATATAAASTSHRPKRDRPRTNAASGLYLCSGSPSLRRRFWLKC